MANRTSNGEADPGTFLRGLGFALPTGLKITISHCKKSIKYVRSPARERRRCCCFLVIGQSARSHGCCILLAEWSDVDGVDCRRCYKVKSAVIPPNYKPSLMISLNIFPLSESESESESESLLDHHEKKTIRIKCVPAG